MISISASTKAWAATEPVDFRKGIDGLNPERLRVRFHLTEPGNFADRSHRSVSDVLFKRANSLLQAFSL